mgnify:CR=1 FL=1
MLFKYNIVDKRNEPLKRDKRAQKYVRLRKYENCISK